MTSRSSGLWWLAGTESSTYPDCMFESVKAKGYQIEFYSHSQAILGVDFPAAIEELEAALLASTIPIEEIIGGGGGESKGTQRLRKAMAAKGWPKFTFTVEKIINGVARESISHEIDHVRTFENGTRIALEIEWNNKDPFYDRDLENFKRLHADGAISAGVIVTRGLTLQANMKPMVRRFMDEREINTFADLEKWDCSPTAKQRKHIMNRVTRTKNPIPFREAFTDKFVSDKYGEATTHWRKLETRVSRGVGNPCPLVLIGLPDTIVTFHEGESALAELEAGQPPEEMTDAEE